MNNIINKLKKYDIISFDIFDTLIVRNISNPHDIYDIVEKKYNYENNENMTNFKELRIYAERDCRKSSKYEEITLDEIYIKLQEFYNLEQVKKLKKIEVDVEKDFCQFNNNIKTIYEWCKNNKKTIIITSDMYLSEETIKEILKKNNITYDALFLSSTYRKTKQTGELFKCVIEKYKGRKIIHIGDSKKSDYVSPRKNGISSIKWKKTIYSKYDSLNENIIASFINNNFKFKTYEEKFGQLCFGPLLYCFSLWLKNNLVNNKINKVFFLARDGFIMQKAFNIVDENSSIYNQYFYASRRSIIVLSLWKCINVEEMFSKMHLNKSIKIKSLLKKLGLDDLELDDTFYKKYKIKENYEYSIDSLMKNNNTKKMLEDLYPMIVENSKREFKSFLEYKNKQDFNGKVAIVDIGWFGNMQHALESLDLDTDIYGYYVGVEPRKNYQKEQKMYGFLFETDKNFDYFLKEHNFNAIFEMLFLAQHGSVKRFNSNRESGVELYDYEYEDSEDKEKIINIQNSALQFCKLFKKSDLDKYLLDDYEKCFKFMEKELLYPNNSVAKYFGDFKFSDVEEKYIAKPSNIFKYINIKRFINDYKASTWRVGFLKRCFKLKLPYYKINMKIREKYLSRGER